MGIKKVALLALVAMATVYVGCTRKSGDTGGGAGSGGIHIYTWSNYFSDELLQKFTAKTGLKVQVSYFSSNEELLAKLKAGAKGYDIIQPSDYMVKQMSRLNMLAPIDHAKVPNLKHLDEQYTKVPYDPGNVVSVPFTWGTTGIALNTDKVKVPAEGVSWKMLFDSPDAKHTSLLDDMREVFAVALRLKGHDINTVDAKLLDEARADISKGKSKILMFTSEPKALLLKGELNIAHIFSADGIQANKANPKIRYFLPTEGATIWTDNLAIPSSSEKVADAHKFIDFLMEPEVAAQIVREKKLATVNKAGRELLTPEEKSDPQIFPPADALKKATYLEDIGENLQAVNRLWTELKS